MSVTIAINNIKEEEFYIRNQEIKKFSEKNLSIGFALGFEYDLEKEFFSVLVRIFYSYLVEGADRTDLMRFVSKTRFHVKGLPAILKAENEHFNLPDFYMMTFVSTAWSSSRGMLAYKLAGTYLANHYLPLVDPKEFLNQIKKSSDTSEVSSD